MTNNKQSTGPIDLIPGANCLEYAFVGSRVTCEPPVLDTDCDIIVLFERYPGLAAMQSAIYQAGGEQCGEDYGGEAELIPMRLGDHNYLLTLSPTYYRTFLHVTAVAKHLNLLDKADRKAVFACLMDGDTSYMTEGSRIKSHAQPLEDFL
jgi:hypothetical protein